MAKTATVFWLSVGNISLRFSLYEGVSKVRQTEKHTAERQVPERSVFEIELTNKKLESHKSPVLNKTLQNELRHSVGKYALISLKFLILF